MKTKIFADGLEGHLKRSLERLGKCGSHRREAAVGEHIVNMSAAPYGFLQQ